MDQFSPDIDRDPFPRAERLSPLPAFPLNPARPVRSHGEVPLRVIPSGSSSPGDEPQEKLVHPRMEGCCPPGGNNRQQWPLSTRMYTNIEPQNASS